MIWIYDIEVFCNYFSVIFKNPNTKEIKDFIIFEDRNDIDELYTFINDKQKWLIGYNSFNFDNQLLGYISKRYNELTFMPVDEITGDIYFLAKLIIEREYTDYRYNLPFSYIDLMKLGGILKSLKLVGVQLKWHKLQDLPIEWTNSIKKEDLKLIHEYNLNDVLITETLYNHLLDKIKLRFEISEMYKINAYSESDSGMANRILEKFYSETTGLAYKDFKYLRTNRDFIMFKDVVFDNIKFHTNTLINLLKEIKKHTYFKAQPFYNKKIIYDGVQYKLGIGGIHSVDRGSIFEEDDNHYIIDADIGSMYPTLMINHNLTPEHLGDTFMYKYRELKDKRLKAKREGKTAENESLKIVLNATYGKAKNKNHWLYDPLVPLQVTINGQLYVLMLIEKLVLNGFEVISANTDGVTAIVPKTKFNVYQKICKQWELDTNFDLEYTYYTKYARRDVNNYIAIKSNGEVKTKGIFSNELNFMKGFDKPIVSISLYNYFVHQAPIRDTILKHKDIYDFCTAKKIDNKFTNEFHYLTNGKYTVDILQKSVRYYVSTDGGTLLKTNRDEGVVTNYEVSKRVTIFNDYIEKKDYKIDYAFYIHQTQKIIDEIIKPQLKLF